MKTFRIGLIGAGIRSHFVAHEAALRPGVEITAVAEPGDASFDRLCAANHATVRRYAEYRAMLSEETLDAVFVMSPDMLHEEHACAALRAGLPVYLEKPLEISAIAAKRMVELAAALHGKLYVGHNMRFYSIIVAMKQLIDSGVIGRVQGCWATHHIQYGGDAYFKDWHSERVHCNSLLFQKGAHDIDVIHFLCNSHTVATSAMGKLSVYQRAPVRSGGEVFIGDRCSDANWPPLANSGMSPHIDVEDMSMMLMQLENGVLASYQQCHYTPDHLRRYSVIGDAGRLENCGTGGENCSIKLYTSRCSSHPEALPDAEYRYHIDPARHSGSDPLIFDEFLGYCRGERRPSVTCVDAFHAVAAADAATNSLRSGGGLVAVEQLSGTTIEAIAGRR